MNKRLDRRSKLRCGALICAASLMASVIASAEDNLSAKPTTSNSQTATQQSTMTKNSPQYRFKLSAHDLDAIILKHRAIASNKDISQLDEVIVTRQTELLPMRSRTREVWGGLGAPIWAVVHPTQAWRIFVPVPEE